MEERNKKLISGSGTKKYSQNIFQALEWIPENVTAISAQQMPMVQLQLDRALIKVHFIWLCAKTNGLDRYAAEQEVSGQAQAYYRASRLQWHPPATGKVSL